MAKKINVGMLVLLCFSAYHQKTYSQELNPEDKVGYLKVDIIDQDSIYVVINDNFDSIREIASGDTLALPPGVTNVRIIKQYYMDGVRSSNIEEGGIRRLSMRLIPVRGIEFMSRRSSYPRLFWEANNFILSDPDTDLYINDKYVGRHFATIDTTESFELTGVHPSGNEFKKKFRPDDGAPFTFHQKHLKPSRSNARILSFLPGGSQFYKKQHLKGAAFSIVTLGGAFLVYSYESRYRDSISEFNQLETRYISASNPIEAFRLGAEAEVAYDRSVSLSRDRNRILYGTALVYLVNIVDGFRAPSIGFRNESRTIDPYLDFDIMYRQPVIGIKSSF